MAESSHLVVLVAPRGLLAGIRDALQDWSAVGLLAPVCWVEDPPEEGAGRVTATEIVGGRSTTTTLEQLVANRDYTRIRLVLLVPAFRDAEVVPAAGEDHLSQLIRRSRGRAVVECLRITVTRSGAGPGLGVLAREGWHNVVLSPEDSRGPGLGQERLQPSDDPIEIGAPAAAAISALTGLWAGIPDAPLDGLPLLPAQHARVARAYFRHLEAGELEEAVRSGVLTMQQTLPRPRVGGTGRAVAVDNVALATAQMAEQLWTRNAGVLRGPRETAPPVTVQPIGVGKALTMLFGFLGAAIKGAPKAWAVALMHRASSSIARTVQGAVFGHARSAYEVVMRGVRPDGSFARWGDLNAASTQLSELVSDPRERALHHADLGLPGVWRDYVGAALTLVDAGPRSAQLPPVVVGVEPGVLTRPADCAPDASADFTEIPVTLSSSLGLQRIEPADVLTRDEVRQQLGQWRTDQTVGVDADRMLSALDAWAARHQHAFVVQAGGYLAHTIGQLRAEVQHLLTLLREASAELDDEDSLQRKQRRLAAWMRGLLIGLIVVLVGTGVLGGLEVIEWSTAGIVGGSAVLVWLVSSFVVFLRGQRDFFAELHRRETAKSQAEISRVNLGHALSDLRRTTGAYRQHLVWSRALGALLRQPFGEQADRPAPARLAKEGLPRSMALGFPDPEPTLLANTTAQVRRDAYRAGWLTGPWESLLAEAPSRLGPDGTELSGDPEELYRDPGHPQSLLSRFVDSVVRHGPGPQGGIAFWRQVSWLGGSLADGLIQRVRDDGEPVTLSSFMSGIDNADGRAASFDGALFTATARTRQADAVVGQWRRGVRTGLGVTAVLVEFSEGLPSYELEGVERVEEPSWPEAPDTGMDF